MKLELQQATYQYQSKYQTVTAVNGVTYTFAPGTFYAIIGKSGCGKTTLLSLLAALRRPTSGEVLVDGEPTSRLDGNRLRRERISVIYQDFNLFPLLTVEENVAYPLRLRREPADKSLHQAQKALAQVGLKRKQFRRLPATLSGGEQQRVAIARSLVMGSEVVLADEPTGSLDGENSRITIDALCQLAHEEDRCVIVVTHDMGVADRADVVLTMQDGNLVETTR
jgi:putative ABC transport system ATP-binding protein